MDPLDDVIRQLATIEQAGAPEQIARAREIAAALRGNPNDGRLSGSLRQLHDAVLHDPYLTRD
jgi:hypothetical protein